MRSAYYQPSGRFSPGAMLLTLLFVPLLLPLSWLYAWTVFHLPHVIAFFAALALSFLIFVASAAVVHWGKVRNAAAALAAGVILGAAAWYAHWTFLAALAALAAPSAGATPGPLAFARDPGDLYATVSAITAPTAWTWFKWTLECGAMALLPALCAATLARRPFCEVAAKWADEVRLEPTFAAIGDAARPAFKAALEAAPAKAMALLGEGPASPHGYAQVSVYPCEQAGIAFLSVCSITQRLDADRLKESRTSVVELLTMPLPAALELIARCGVATAAAPRPAPDKEAGPAATAQQLQPAVQALEAEQYEQALALALPYCTIDHPALQVDAVLLCALANSRLERWDEAARQFKRVYAAAAGAHNALQLATASVMAGRLEEGEKWIRTTLALNRDTPELPAIQIYTSYITALKQRSHLREAMPYLEAVKEIYEQLHLTDPTFLTLRGVPFLISFLEQSAAVVDAAMAPAQARAWYQSMLPHLDPPGRNELKAWLSERNDSAMPMS